jgi:mono/diheme cytochrome c family protein
MQSKEPRMIKLAALTIFFVLALGYVLSQQVSYADPLTQTARTTNPLQATEKNTALGLDHFAAHCAACHASTGKADNERGKAVKAADLTSDKIQSKTDAELFRIISKGVPGTAMPAFEKTHKPTEIWQTILFLRRLPTLTADQRANLESAIPAEARHKHPEPEAHHEHPTQAQDKPATRQQQPSTEHQHEKSQTQQAQKPAQPAQQPAQPQQEHHHDAQPPAKQTGEVKHDAAAHDMSKMDNQQAGHDRNAMMSTVTGGPFKSLHAIGSGTSLLPASVPGYMWRWMKGDWMIMAHGNLIAGFNHQGGPRGVNKAESQNWLMLMAERPAGGGRLMVRGMFSAEPWTAPRRGFPELFQTGETFEGRPIIDAQHPHDLFMELAAQYTLPLSENVSINLYGGPVGEPALGPVAFMHRTSAMETPAAVLGHHWQDSTHIAHGVFTAGVTAGKFRVEGSIFRGAEPDENRKDIELGKLDSYSGRIWFTPTPEWTMQVSYGHLTHPEILEPGDLRRITASIHHNKTWTDGNWASSLIWGRNHEEHGNSNAYTLESTVNFVDKNHLYTRLELGDKIGLLQENIWGRTGLVPARHIGDAEGNDSDHQDDLADRWFRVGAFTFGGVRDIISDSKLRVGVGADVTFYHIPDGLKGIYGSSPKSFHLFLRIRPGKMSH